MPRRLRHALPPHIHPLQCHFYITQCALPRNRPTLIPVADDLVLSIRHYHQIQRWFCHAHVIMPDHLHLLIEPCPDRSIGALMRTWKSYTAKKLLIRWQDDFFDHRLRSDESAAEKARYMELNPVRANLVQNPEEWKWFGYGAPW